MAAAQVDSSDPQALESPHGFDFQMRVRGGVIGLGEMLFVESGGWRGRYHSCLLVGPSNVWAILE